MNKNNFKINSTIIVFFCSFLFLAILEYLQIKYTFPITDGWWETYAWLYSEGEDVYAEAGLKFPPLFVLIINFLQSTLGLNHYQERIIFLLIRLITVYITYAWLRHYYNKYESLIAAMLPALLIYGNPVYLTKDYHVVVAFLVVSALYILTSNVIRRDHYSSNYIAILLGFLCALILLTKQNIGLFFSAGVFVYIVKVEYIDLNCEINGLLRKILFGLVGFAIPIAIGTYLMPGWYAVLLGNNSKGSISTVLFRFLLDKSALLYLVFSMVLYVFYKVWMFLTKEYLVMQEAHKRYIPDFALFLVITAVISTLKIPMFIICLSLAWPMIVLKNLTLNGNLLASDYYKYNLWIVLYAYAYCGTNTAGYNYVTVDYLIAFFVAGVLEVAFKSSFLIKKNAKKILGLCVFIMAPAPKLISNEGYNWWGLKSGGIFQSTELMPYKELSGLYTDVDTARILDKAKKYNSQLKADESFFAYPSIPILYLLDKQRPLGAAVLWFDVSTNNDAQKTIVELERRPPKIIYWLRPPRSVYNGHFNLRKSDPAMALVDGWLFKSLINGKYQVIETLPTFEHDSQYETKLFAGTLKFDYFTKNKSTYVELCSSLSGCAVSEYDKFTFENAKSFFGFMSNAKDIMNSEFHILYILKLTD